MKTASEMTYYVLGGALNSTHSLGLSNPRIIGMLPTCRTMSSSSYSTGNLSGASLEKTVLITKLLTMFVSHVPAAAPAFYCVDARPVKNVGLKTSSRNVEMMKCCWESIFGTYGRPASPPTALKTRICTIMESDV